jgi:excisionase family DNA binding protein
MKLLGTNEAANRLGVSTRRVRALIAEGKLQATYVGGGYVIEENALDAVKVYGKAGRPPKAKVETNPKAIKKKGNKK